MKIKEALELIQHKEKKSTSFPLVDEMYRRSSHRGTCLFCGKKLQSSQWGICDNCRVIAEKVQAMSSEFPDRLINAWGTGMVTIVACLAVKDMLDSHPELALYHYVLSRREVDCALRDNYWYNVLINMTGKSVVGREIKKAMIFHGYDVSEHFYWPTVQQFQR